MDLPPLPPSGLIGPASQIDHKSHQLETLTLRAAASNMPVGVPHGSILGRLLFFIYVNDLPDRHLSSDVILYADDTVIYYSPKNLSDLEDHIDAGLGTVSERFSRNLLTLNISKRNFCN